MVGRSIELRKRCARGWGKRKNVDHDLDHLMPTRTATKLSNSKRINMSDKFEVNIKARARVAQGDKDNGKQEVRVNEITCNGSENGGTREI